MCKGKMLSFFYDFFEMQSFTKKHRFESAETEGAMLLMSQACNENDCVLQTKIFQA